MKILFVADGRSPITRRWLETTLSMGYQISFISTFPCQPIDRIQLAAILPVAFSSLAGSQVDAVSKPMGRSKPKLAGLRPLMQKARYYFGPLTLPFYYSQFISLASEIKPDLVHALRIPFEGMLASCLPQGIPLLVSTWGNDLTLHARGSLLMGYQTRKVLNRTDGLFSDTQRDIRLARSWGLRPTSPAIEVPGNGGLNLDEIQKIQEHPATRPGFLKKHHPIIINPRGFRPGSVHQDVFFQSLPEVIRDYPDVLFICTSMQGQDEAIRQVKTLGIENNVILLPYLNQKELWNLYRQSRVYVSLSSHDGTPNTLLEAMAFGCLPVCGDIESIREWINDGENGLLVNPWNSHSASQAILNACRDQILQEKAKKQNWEIIQTRANGRINQQAIMSFYQSFLKE
jgi:glycosyltransferase involved in cell wall biosynthesis